VEVQPPDFGSGPTGLSDVATTADCLQWFGGITNQEDQAAVLNLEPFLDADPELSQADFYSQALDTFTYQGQLWGLPAEMNISVINYNKTLFDEARVPYPQPDWTTDDFLAAAVALTQGDDPATRQYGYVPQEFEINDLTTFLERLSAQFLDENEDPPQLSFTHPTMVEAMRWVTSLTTEFAVKPTFITNIGEGAFGLGEERKALIENGRAAMWSDQGFPTFPEINLDDLAVGIAPLPAGPDGTVTASNAITGYFISATTAQRQACWQWITFLSQQPFTGTYGNTFPARRTVAESAAYAQAVGPEQAAANLASVENITGPSVALRLSTDANWLTLGHFWWQSYAYHQILTASVPVEEALAAVQAKADAYRDCVIQRDGLADQNIQRTCLGEVDDTVPPSWLEIDEAE
jgi:ABC-type glycerol-3-phosphate transport system substrate-binding protein